MTLGSTWLYQLLVIKQLSKTFGSVIAVKDVSLELKAGQKCCLVGPTGGGKTTLLRLIAGLEQPDQGEIFIRRRLVSSKAILIPPHQRKVGMVFQNLALWPHVTVFKHILLTMDSNVKHKEKRQKAKDILHLMGLAAYSKRYPAMLSGGQRQKLAIARMMSSQAEIALLDEPFAHLDPDTKDEMRSLVHQWIKSNGITCIMVTHDPLENFSYFDTIAVMRKGTLVCHSKPEDEKYPFEYTKVEA